MDTYNTISAVLIQVTYYVNIIHSLQQPTTTLPTIYSEYINYNKTTKLHTTHLATYL